MKFLSFILAFLLLASCNVVKHSRKEKTTTDTTIQSVDTSHTVKITTTKGELSINTDTLTKLFPLKPDSLVVYEAENTDQRVKIELNKKTGIVKLVSVQKPRKIQIDKTEKEIIKAGKTTTTTTNTSTDIKEKNKKSESKAIPFVKWLVVLVILIVLLILLIYFRKKNSFHA